MNTKMNNEHIRPETPIYPFFGDIHYISFIGQLTRATFIAITNWDNWGDIV